MHYDKLRTRIANAQGLVVEICGPTPEGFEFLDKIEASFSIQPIVTNIENPVTLYPYSDNPQVFEVDEIADVKDLPYANDSVDILLVSSLPLRDVAGSDAEAEYNHLNSPVHNLHLHLYKEASRTLKTGGLLIQVSPFTQDEKAANHFHLATILYDQDTSTIIFENKQQQSPQD